MQGSQFSPSLLPLQTQEKPVYASAAFPPALVGSSRKYLLVENQYSKKGVEKKLCACKKIGRICLSVKKHGLGLIADGIRVLIPILLIWRLRRRESIFSAKIANYRHNLPYKCNLCYLYAVSADDRPNPIPLARKCLLSSTNENMSQTSCDAPLQNL